jgi:hypothetical protein
MALYAKFGIIELQAEQTLRPCSGQEIVSKICAMDSLRAYTSELN